MKKKKKNNFVRERRKHKKMREPGIYEIALNRSDRRNIVSQIQKQKGSFICRRSNRVTEWRVQAKGQKAIVLYDKIHKCIVAVFL